jgi:ABC-type antimicrobial peptide transport system ATPase subunit
VAIRLPENTNATAGNGGESQSYKAAGLASIIQPTSDSLRFEDRHAAWLAGVEHGRAERIDFEIEDQIQIRIHDRVRASLGLAKQYAAAKGPSWLALISECGEVDD